MSLSKWYCTRNVFKLLTLVLLGVHEAASAGPRPTQSSWYYVTASAIADVITSVTGGTKEGDDDTSTEATEDWSALQNAMANAKAKVSELFDGFTKNDAVQAAPDLQTTIDSLRDNMPELPSLKLDLEYIKQHVSGWNWDNFAKEMLPSPEVPDTPEEDFQFDSDKELPPECSMTVPEMIRHAGYRCEVHTAETNDGYLLELHRIPFSRNYSTQAGRKRGSKRPVVFFQHGILADSSCWVANGPDRSLPYLLADAGCDVWLGNVRGSTYSRGHKTLNADADERYWRFTWQHMAQSDLPAMINRALRETGQRSLYYVGHSQGTLIAFARLAEDPLFNDKIRMMFAFGPVSTLAHITSPVRNLVSLSKLAHLGLSTMGGTEVLPKKALSQWISATLHKLDNSNASIIYHGNNLMMFLCGVHPDHYFQDRLPVYFSHSPAGTSLQNLIHMGQLVASGKMQKWDHWSETMNRDAYGQDTPPEYNTSLIRTPVALFVGSEDHLADPIDNKLLSEKLKSLVHYRVLDGWDHLDFLWGRDAVGTVYKEVLDFITGSTKPAQPPSPSTKQINDEL